MNHIGQSQHVSYEAILTVEIAVILMTIIIALVARAKLQADIKTSCVFVPQTKAKETLKKMQQKTRF